MKKRYAIVGIVSVFWVPIVGAGVVGNGTFESDMAEWIAEGNVAQTSDGIGDTGSASLYSNVEGEEYGLIGQSLTIDATDQYLSFQFQEAVQEEGETDYFYVSLSKGAGPTYELLEFYVWSSGTPGGTLSTTSGVQVATELLTDERVLYTVEYEIEPEWKTAGVFLQFLLEHEYDDDIETDILLDNVLLSSESVLVPMVPVPAAAWLLLSGIVLGYKRRRGDH